MENFINWFEIPASDFERAVEFYRALLNVEIQVMTMDDMKMGMLPSDGSNVSGAIVKGEGAVPADSGVLVYLNGGEDLQTVLNRVVPNGGQVIVPKTQISPEYGFFALFTDTEGNKLGLHSMQ
ncbi:VOC family protein [Parapedobacter sp. DT-150]|uniref:VOC family protein n=1 Tax=Parapedobacter sp. DT-150 TaxID=3396162 RepID=UPI003F1B4E75